MYLNLFFLFGQIAFISNQEFCVIILHFGIADHIASRRKNANEFLDHVNELIDWRPIVKFLNKKLQRKTNAVGTPSYPVLVMFKILLLQRWYALSDLAME